MSMVSLDVFECSILKKLKLRKTNHRHEINSLSTSKSFVTLVTGNTLPLPPLSNICVGKGGACQSGPVIGLNSFVGS
jgi:hypothetical protein